MHAKRDANVQNRVLQHKQHAMKTASSKSMQNALQTCVCSKQDFTTQTARKQPRNPSPSTSAPQPAPAAASVVRLVARRRRDVAGRHVALVRARWVASRRRAGRRGAGRVSAGRLSAGRVLVVAGRRVRGGRRRCRVRAGRRGRVRARGAWRGRIVAAGWRRVAAYGQRGVRAWWRGRVHGGAGGGSWLVVLAGGLKGKEVRFGLRQGGPQDTRGKEEAELDVPCSLLRRGGTLVEGFVS